MPYVTCPNCNDTYHIKIGIDIEEWSAKYPCLDDGIRYIECFHCWKELKEFDVIEIISLPQSHPENIVPGDKATIVMVHSATEFEVECVDDDGTTKWLATLSRKHLKYVCV